MAERVGMTASMKEGEEATVKPEDIDLEAAAQDESHEEKVNTDLAVQRVRSAGKPYSYFSLRARNFIATVASISTFFSPLTASIYFPALNAIASELNVSNTLVNLTVTTYMVFLSSCFCTCVDMYRITY